jgi:AcrR family transcriptional regulator
MARTRPAERVASLIDAAVRVFCRKGFCRAQMADIAREMGVSPGLLYNYVESRESLFYLVVAARAAPHQMTPGIRR